METQNARQLKYYKKHTDRCVSRKILKNVRQGGAPMPSSLLKYAEYLTPDVLFANFKKYTETEKDENIKEKKTDIFLQRIRCILV